MKVNVKFEDGTGRLAKASVPMGFVKVNESRPYLLTSISYLLSTNEKGVKRGIRMGYGWGRRWGVGG